ncbi:hypothetical protein ACHQM5_023167 [Ranunculus cassubicifolius]
MSDRRDVSDELLWKKELTALRKAAKVLRDPETTCSLKSPLSSRSVAGASSLNHSSGRRGHSTGKNQIGRPSELDFSPLKGKHSQKQVFLYNWRHPHSKSSDSGDKLDGRRNYGSERQIPSTPGYSSSDANKEGSMNTARDDCTSKSSDSGAKFDRRRSYENERPIPSTPGDSSSDANREGSKKDAPFDDPIVLFRVREANLETLAQKALKKSKKGSAAPRRSARKSASSKVVDLPSISSGEPLTSIDQSDDTEYCNSEDLRLSTLDLLRKSGYTSKPASPFLSRRENRPNSSKLPVKVRREDSSISCTPASTSSYNRYRKKIHNAAESWDDTTASFNGDEADLLDLSKRQGCGIPCYWSKRTPKDRSCGGFYSPSLSDTLRRKGSSILCGSQTLSHKGRPSRSSRRKLVSKSAQGLPLLSKSCDGKRGTSVDSGETDDELSTNFGEVDLEALSRLDGRRWSFSCGSQEGLELVAFTGTDQGIPDHAKSLSKKYSPKFFDEIIGQNIVVQSLTNAILRERIAPVYLFQGPRGTGKTSIARIFSAALNCVATEETKPCGSCRECANFVSGKSMNLREVDATNKKGIDRVKYLLKSLSAAPPSHFSHYKVFIIDECHLLPTKTWSAFMKFLEEPPAHIVFIFIATDVENLPRTVLSRCQKFIFNKIGDADIVTRLKKLAVSEKVDYESHALHLIALNADGSLRDAETMLEQLSLLGKRISASLVNELVGVVPDEKLLDLLELAMSSDTAETVKRSRELMNSGVDPMALMSQLAGLMMDIIAGTDHLAGSKHSGFFFGGRSLTEAEVERLKQALKLLLEAEKQLRLSSERSTWFTAALLQLGSVPSPDPTSSSGRKSSKTTDEGHSNSSWDIYAHKNRFDSHIIRKSTSSSTSQPSSFDGRPLHGRTLEGGTPLTNTMTDAEKLDNIWEKCIERCHSKTLRQLLHAHGKLVSISEIEGDLIALVAFENGDIKSRAERFLSSITNSIETVVRRNVEVRLGILPDYELYLKKEMFERETAVERPRKSFNAFEATLPPLDRSAKETAVPLSVQKIIDEQRLESAWLQSAEKGTPTSLNRLKPERNQILPQDGASHQTEQVSSRKWEDELNREIKALKINDTRSRQKDHYPMSPSLLHNRGSAVNGNKDNLGYESGANAGSCGGLLCWTTKPNKKGKVKPGTPIRLHKKRQFSCFGQCGKTKKTRKRL